MVMGRGTPGRDWGLTSRMIFVMAMLALVYFLFIAVHSALGIPWLFIGIIAAVMLGVQYFLSDKLVLMAMRAKIVSPAEQPRLHAIVDRLAAEAGLPKPKIAVADTDMPNAFATGRSPRAAAVCVTTGIMQRLNDEELEAVLGHELSHIKNRDVMVITLASFFATVAGMLAQSMLWMSMFGGGRSRREGGASAIMLAWFVSMLVYFVATLLIMALSRYREYAADRAGAILTRMPSRLASALAKISNAIARIPAQDLRKTDGANAFFIVSALSGETLINLFSTHPPLHKRVERLRALERELEGF